jgi:ribulose-5-phosphate 4-epimerase/fuculose-1-phosphate aldolase
MNIKSLKGSVPDDEWQARVDLAACYRLIAMYGWDDLVFTHVSARVPGPEERFLINPFGMMFEEITASSLILINSEGEKVRESDFPVNQAGFVIHSAVHAGRPDVGCVLHTHTADGIAVSAQKDGLLPISQTASVVLASLGYHDYEGIAVRDDEKPRLQEDLGDNLYLILRNHGLLTVGPTVSDAFLYMYALQTACEAQVKAQSSGQELVHVAQPILDGVEQNLDLVMRGMRGALIWPGLCRKLDRVNPGYAD